MLGHNFRFSYLEHRSLAVDSLVCRYVRNARAVGHLFRSLESRLSARIAKAPVVEPSSIQC